MAPLLLAFLIPFLRPQQIETGADPAAWLQLIADFQARGVRVRSDHPRCAEPDLDGLYRRGDRELVVCERGDRSLTLRHEGWHLVQTLCLHGRPWLSHGEVEQRLQDRDRRELEQLVSPDRRGREAEARVMAVLPVARYLQEVDQACRLMLPRHASQPVDG